MLLSAPERFSRIMRLLPLVLTAMTGNLHELQAAAVTVSPAMERCMALAKQIEDVSKAQKLTLSGSIKRHVNEGRSFCAAGKTAQGTRAYAIALKLLGQKPVVNHQPNGD